MTPSDYLDASKLAIGIQSDNALATIWHIHRQRISAYRNNTEWPDNYAVMMFAVALKLDPAKVLADLEAQREKNPVKRAFWQSFCSRASTAAALLCTLVLIYTATSTNAYGMEPYQGHRQPLRIIRNYVNRWLSTGATRLKEIIKTCWIPCTALAI